MTEKTAWADLPNAKYIDLVMDSVKKNPAKWFTARYVARGAAWDAASTAAREAASDAASDAAWGAVRYEAQGMARDAARGAALALIAWDDCGYLLEEKSEDVKMLSLLGNHAAVLLYPACIALQNTKDLEMVVN
jgi:hypothetical protein